MPTKASNEDKSSTSHVDLFLSNDTEKGPAFLHELCFMNEFCAEMGILNFPTLRLVKRNMEIFGPLIVRKQHKIDCCKRNCLLQVGARCNQFYTLGCACFPENFTSLT